MTIQIHSLRSSTVEQGTLNPEVVGSIPIGGIVNLYQVSKFKYSDQREGDYYDTTQVLAKTPGAAFDAVFPTLDKNRTYKIRLVEENIKQAGIG